ncbi:MAG: alpha/beta hydrolase [Pseudomonadota bacterium]
MRFIKWTLLVVAALLILAAYMVYQPDLPVADVDAKYSNEASQFLVLDNGARIHFRDQGLTDGYPIVLIHGAMASLHTWEPWVEILGQDYRVITLDLPAHGLTGAVPDGSYGAGAFTKTIHDVTTHLGLGKFVLGGNSMGGGATWRYAISHPTRVSHMILLNSSGPRRQPQRQTSNDDNNSSPFAPLSWAWFRAVAEHVNPRFLVERGLRSAYNHSPVVTDELVDRYNNLILREGTRAAILNRNTRQRRAEETYQLANLNQPALIIWGRQDSVIPVSVGEELARVLPDSKLVIYDELGHIPMEEDPQRSATDVLAFLQEFQQEQSAF